MPMSMNAGDDNAMSSDMHNCETTQSSQSDKAKGFLCKLTTQCQIGSLYHPVAPTSVSRPAGLSSPVVFHYAQSLSIRTPAGLWRPPRAL